MDLYYLYNYDIFDKKEISSCRLNPTDVLKKDACWLWALNNKYDDIDVDSTKVGKWMVFLPKTKVNETWNKIKEAIKEGHLWHSKVSTSDPSDATYAIMIYTKDYTDTDDVINVLNYLETTGIKPSNKVIKYKTDEQTRAGIYSRDNQKASIYASDSIRLKYGKIQNNILSWRTSSGSSR